MRKKLADTVVPASEVTRNETVSTIPELIGNMIDFILPVIAAVAVLMVIYGGVLYITSGGDPEKTGKAKKTLLWAVLGVMVVVLAYAIVVTLNNIAVDKI